MCPSVCNVYFEYNTRAAVVHLNFRAGSTFPVLVYTVPPGHWVNRADTNRTSRCNKVDAVRLKVEFTFTKGSAVRDIVQTTVQCIVSMYLRIVQDMIL